MTPGLELVHRAPKQIEHGGVARDRVQERHVLRSDVRLHPRGVDRDGSGFDRIRLGLEFAEPLLEHDRRSFPVVRPQVLRLPGGAHLDHRVRDVDREIGDEPLGQLEGRQVRGGPDLEQDVPLMRDPDPTGGRTVDQELVASDQHVRQRADDRDVVPGRERQCASDAEVTELRRRFREDPLSGVEPGDETTLGLREERREPGLDPGRVDRDHVRGHGLVDGSAAGIRRSREPGDVCRGRGRGGDRRDRRDARSETVREATGHPR